MFMKTVEEKWTAWLDDELLGDERVAFEHWLEDRRAAGQRRAHRSTGRRIHAGERCHERA